MSRHPFFAGLRPAVPGYVFDAFYPRGWVIRQRADIEAFLDAEGDRVWVAAGENLILGWIGMRLHPEDNLGEIHILAVDPEHQHRGIGKALAEFALEHMRTAGMAIAMVETRDDPAHITARSLYRRRRLRTLARRPLFPGTLNRPQRCGAWRASSVVCPKGLVEDPRVCARPL